MTDTNNDDDSDSDEWGMEELIIPAPNKQGESKKGDEDHGDSIVNENTGGDDEYWNVEPTTSSTTNQDESSKDDPEKSNTDDDGGEPMIIVDITQIDPTIHSKYDRNSVNDPTAASAIRKKIEGEYTNYARNNIMISDGTVIPCGSSVWNVALARLRDERPGHYFAPIFPPKKR